MFRRSFLFVTELKIHLLTNPLLYLYFSIKQREGRGVLIFEGKAIILKFNFDHQEGQLFERGVHLMGDSNSRVHDTCTCILNLKFKYMFSVLTESAY